MLTQKDMDSIKGLMNASNKEVVSALTKLITRTVAVLRKETVSREETKRIVSEKLDEKTKFLPTKYEFYQKMDKVIGELKAVRESQEMHAGDHARISDRLDKLEKVLIPNN